MRTVGNGPPGARPDADTSMRSTVLLMELATQSDVPRQASATGPDSTATGAPTATAPSVAPCTALPLKQAAYTAGGHWLPWQQRPAEQLSPARHDRPQAPQFMGSEARAAHCPPQVTSEVVQTTSVLQALAARARRRAAARRAIMATVLREKTRLSG